MTVSAILAMTGLVTGLCVLCGILAFAMQRHSALIWMGLALAIGIIESLALKDGDLTALDRYLTIVTVPFSYVCVAESVRAAYGRQRSSRKFFSLVAGMVWLTLFLMQMPLAPVLQYMPSQLVGAIAMVRAIACVQQDRRRGDWLDMALLGCLSSVALVYILRIPVFPVLVGLDSPFTAIARQDLQDVLIGIFAVLVPGVVILTIARVVSNALQTYRMQAEYDFLTGLPNRRAFEEQAGHTRRGSGALVICDIDRFKTINDRFGHAAGDAVIRAVGSLLDGRGLTARIGGEEFAIWMPRANLSEARHHAERLRHELTTLRLAELKDEATITASFGVAGCESKTALGKAMAEADRALYDAKESGRNCVVVFGEEAENRARDEQRAA